MKVYHTVHHQVPNLDLKIWTDGAGKIVRVCVGDRDAGLARFHNLLPLFSAETIADLYEGIRRAKELDAI